MNLQRGSLGNGDTHLTYPFLLSLAGEPHWLKRGLEPFDSLYRSASRTEGSIEGANKGYATEQLHGAHRMNVIEFGILPG